MAIDYGSDFAGIEDVDAFLTVIPGTNPLGMTQGLIRRFDTTRGALHYDESYGLLLSQFILDSMPPEVAESLVIAEALKDERCAKCLCRITVQVDGSWKIQINPQTEEGDEYELVFLADPTKVALLTVVSL